MPFEAKNIYTPANLPERNSSESSAEKENELQKAARRAKIPVQFIPKQGTVAYERLELACEKYVEKLEQQLEHSEKLRTPTPIQVQLAGNYENGRREAHGQLCSILFGTMYQSTKEEDRTKAANFAAVVMGRKDLRGM